MEGAGTRLAPPVRPLVYPSTSGGPDGVLGGRSATVSCSELLVAVRAFHIQREQGPVAGLVADLGLGLARERFDLIARLVVRIVLP